MCCDPDSCPNSILIHDNDHSQTEKTYSLYQSTTQLTSIKSKSKLLRVITGYIWLELPSKSLPLHLSKVWLYKFTLQFAQNGKTVSI